MSCARDICLFIQSEGFATLGTDMFLGNEPEAQNDALTLTVYDTGGEQGESYVGYQNPTIQIRCRAVVYTTGYAKLVQIRDRLLQTYGFDYSGWHYTGFWLISDIAKIGSDDQNREIFTINFRLMREPI